MSPTSRGRKALERDVFAADEESSIHSIQVSGEQAARIRNGPRRRGFQKQKGKGGIAHRKTFALDLRCHRWAWIRLRMRFSPLGDSAVVAECGEGISLETLQRVRRFANRVAEARIPGVLDIVSAFATVTIFYAPTKIEANDGPYLHLTRILERLAGAPVGTEKPV